uniref:Uncharacterized protein n=1 Tax=Tetranychus urticae TaxID=32264 RepID=T1KYV5_TETUR
MFNPEVMLSDVREVDNSKYMIKILGSSSVRITYTC